MKSIIYLMALMISSVAFATEPGLTSANDDGISANTAAPASLAPAPAEPEAAAADSMPAKSAPAAKTEPAVEQAGFSRGSVVRSIFTTGVQNREPVDKLNNSASDTKQVFYFSELRDMSGQMATHRWEHDGKVIAEVKFNVRGPRWRVWSSKSFVPSWAGDWKVSVVNGAGETISEELISLSGIPHQNVTPESEAAATAPIESSPAETETMEPAMPAKEEPISNID